MDVSTFVDSALIFMEKYREMERADDEVNERFIKEVVSSPWEAEELCNVWLEKQSNFGDFFLNLDYGIQGDFIEAWGIPVPGLQSYKDETDKFKRDRWHSKPPETVILLSGLVRHFCSNDIVDNQYYKLLKYPDYHKISGNSSNWADYLLSGSGRSLIRFIYQVVVRVYRYG